MCDYIFLEATFQSTTSLIKSKSLDMGPRDPWFNKFFG